MNEENPRNYFHPSTRYAEAPELQHMEMLPATEQARFSVREVFSLVRRSLGGLTLWLIVCIGLAVIFLYNSNTSYLGTTQIVLEPRRPPDSSNAVDLAEAALQPALDSAQADSETEVVQSERNLRYVFDTLQITANPLYAAHPPNLLQRLIALVTPSDNAALTPQERAALADAEAFGRFRDRFEVKRIGTSYVMEVSAYGPTADEAVRLANAATESYILGQIVARAASIERGSAYLEGRISDLKTEQDRAAAAVKAGEISSAPFAYADARVVGAAVVPLYKAFPKSKLVLLFAALFGIFTGVGWVFVQQNFDRRIRSRDQVRRALGFEVLGVVPKLPGRRSLRSGPSKLAYTSAVDTPDSSFAQSLRILRTGLFSMKFHTGHLAVGITSFQSGEGSSAVAGNLACLLAASGERVLLIDCDLRKATLTRSLAPNASSGLYESLLKSDEPTKLTEMAIRDNLEFAPAVAAGANVDPNVFIGSERAHRALVDLKKGRHVIVDLPPLSVSPNAQAIGHMLDGLILCVEINRTTLDEVAEVRRALAAANVRLLGVLLTKTPAPAVDNG